MTESQLKTKCKRWVERYYDCYVVLPEQYIKSGDPDMIICLRGYFIAIEFKLPGNKPTKLQEEKLNKIQTSGGDAYLCYSFDEFKQLVRRRADPYNVKFEKGDYVETFDRLGIPRQIVLIEDVFYSNGHSDRKFVLDGETKGYSRGEIRLYERRDRKNYRI